MNLNRLIWMLWDFESENVFNPWRDTDPLDTSIVPDAQRRLRLLAHFNCTPRFLLIGEAPGYQGCHFSGIPFTNERLLMDGAVPRVEVYRRITHRRLPWSEPSATIMWRTLHELGIADCTVMWNAFAWHPHKPGMLHSNRRPTAKELEAGLPVLEGVLEYFSGARVVAVGRVADETMDKLGVKVDAAVRHPSMGGANAFRSGMRELVTGR